MTVFLLTTAGGMLDASVYLGHGHAFATAQSGNVVLLAAALASGRREEAIGRVISLAAFVVGLLMSRFAAEPLRRSPFNSRTLRLNVVAALLAAMGAFGTKLPEPALIAAVAFIAAVQITSLSHIGTWSFNTGMTTGNLRSAATAFAGAIQDKEKQPAHAGTMILLCLAFAVGALVGAWSQALIGNLTFEVVAALVAAAALNARGVPDPVPSWGSLG